MSDSLGDLAFDALHVWRIHLDQSEDLVRTLEEHLCEDEARLAGRYRRDLDRIRYVVAHGALREVLAGYTGQTPRDIAFGHTTTGKPFLADDRRKQPFQFSLSHSGEWAVVGLALSADLGIDIEQIDPDVKAEAVARRFFSRSESEGLRNMPLGQRSVAFFAAWTRKEAYVKARGVGIADRLSSFSVSVDPELIPILLDDSMDPHGPLHWRIYDLDIAEGYAAAIVAEGATHRIRMMHWTPLPT